MGIMINCKEATYLVEKELETKLGLNTKLKLRFHLVLCKVCATYKSQSIVLNQTFNRGPGGKIDAVFVDELKEKIKSKINKIN
jgi:hypothetical protein